MGGFRYELSGLTPDTTGGFSKEAMAALTGNIMAQNVAAELLGLNDHEAEKKALDFDEWTKNELNPETGALSKWKPYESQISSEGYELPSSVEELLEDKPLLEAKLKSLFEAKLSLTFSNEKTPEELNIGSAMNLVIMPWALIRDNVRIGMFSNWVKYMRDAQGIADDRDVISPALIEAIDDDKAIYRSANNSNGLLSSTNYLDRKIDKEGPFGFILAQTSRAAGVKNKDFKNGEAIELAGNKVDGMGIFEWICLTLQEDPTDISDCDYSWLPANSNFDSDDDTLILRGDWLDKKVDSNIGQSATWDSVTQVRLAIS